MVSLMESPKRKGRMSASDRDRRMSCLRSAVSIADNVSTCAMTGMRLVRSARRFMTVISGVDGVPMLMLA